MKKKSVRKRLVLSKFEKLLYGFALFLLVLAPLATVFSQAAFLMCVWSCVLCCSLS